MDNELDCATSRFIEKHLEDCLPCRESLHEFEEIYKVLYGLPRIDPSPDFSRRVVMAAVGASKMADEESVPFLPRLKFALERLSEKIFSLIPWKPRQGIRTLEEFSDYPPLSMSFIYFRLIEQTKQRMLP